MHYKDTTRKSRAAKCAHPGMYHLSADGLTVLRPHSQAETCFARQQGYVVVRIEPWFSDRGQAIVDAMNASADVCAAFP